MNIDELKQLYEKTTQGEWKSERNYVVVPKLPNSSIPRDDVAYHFRFSDAAFIAAAHNHFAELLELAEYGMTYLITHCATESEVNHE